MSLRVLAVAGPSGGHIFPALSLLERLKTKYPDCRRLLVVPRSIRQKQIAIRSIEAKYISLVNLRFRPNFQNIAALFNFLKSSASSVFILIEFKPDVVVGFGSLASLPIVILAWLFRIPTLIHEQNVLPGRANRILAFFADKIAVSFYESARYFPSPAKVFYTGNPIRQELSRIGLDESRSFLGLAKDKFTILVMGGSQGSRRINNEIVQALELIRQRSAIQVIHLAGANNQKPLEDSYGQLGIAHKVFGFLAQMSYAYSASDLVISRAGATALTEIIFYQLPAILIPYPYARKHQSANAAVLQGQGLAVVIQEENLTAGILSENIESFFIDRRRADQIRQNYRSMRLGDAAEELAGVALSLV